MSFSTWVSRADTWCMLPLRSTNTHHWKPWSHRASRQLLAHLPHWATPGMRHWHLDKISLWFPTARVRKTQCWQKVTERKQGQHRSPVQWQKMQRTSMAQPSSMLSYLPPCCGLNWETISEEQKVAHTTAYGATSERGQLEPVSEVNTSLLLTFVLSLQPSYSFWGTVPQTGWVVAFAFI